jgi:hypothetical protein
MQNKTIQFTPCTMETIDFAFYNFINEKLNIFTVTNDGWKKVPALWVTPERAYQIKYRDDLRDGESSLVFPLMTIHRSGVSKDPNMKGQFQANLAPLRNRYFIANELNQPKTNDYARAQSVRENRFAPQLNFLVKKESKKQIYKYYKVPIPVYVTVNYEINIITNYQQQTNEILQKLINVGSGQNYFIIEKDGYRFESFMQQEFSTDSNVASMGEEERKYTSKVTTKVLGYLIGEGLNQDQQIEIHENIVDIKFPQERVLSSKPVSVPRLNDGNESITTPAEETFDITGTDYFLGDDGDG